MPSSLPPLSVLGGPALASTSYQSTLLASAANRGIMGQLLSMPSLEVLAPDSIALKTWRVEAESTHLLPYPVGHQPDHALTVSTRRDLPEYVTGQLPRASWLLSSSYVLAFLFPEPGRGFLVISSLSLFHSSFALEPYPALSYPQARDADGTEASRHRFPSQPSGPTAYRALEPSSGRPLG
jgi:hypothetical protein